MVSFAIALFYDDPPGTFADGHVFLSKPNLTAALEDRANGYWHCDLKQNDKLTWSKKVYELFGLPEGTRAERDWVVSRYVDVSRAALEKVRTYALRRKYGFILDAVIRTDGAGDKCIRILAYPVLFRGRVVALHGLKRAL
jgi:hypothetical protein